MNHPEGNTAIFTIYNKIRENRWRGTVVINAEDTDIYVQAEYVSQNVSGKLLIKKKNIYVGSRTLCTIVMPDIILQSHVVTGCEQNWFLWPLGKKSYKKSYEKLRSKSSVT